MAKQSVKKRFAVCVSNEGYDDLQIWKVYRVVRDDPAAAEDYLRVVDESGEDYLYPANRFVVVDFPPPVVRRLLAIPVSGARR